MSVKRCCDIELYRFLIGFGLDIGLKDKSSLRG